MSKTRGPYRVDPLGYKKANEALDKKAENARELGLDYEPAQQERPSFAEWTSDHVRNNLHKLKPQPVQQDIPDLIAGALGVSRGTAYDMMREALAEQPAQQEPVAWICEGSSSDEKHAIDYWPRDVDDLPIGTQLYTSPPAQRTWVGLSDEEISARAANFYNPEMYKRAALWAQEKLKERNQ